MSSRKGGRLGALAWTVVTLGAVALPAWAVFRTRAAAEPEVARAAGEKLLAKRRVLAIVAHPDDLEWYIGGTLAALDTAGAEVHVIVGTYGEKGPNRTNVPDLAAERRKEQLEAAAINGYDRVHFLDVPDRGLPEYELFLPKVIDIWREFKPDAVLAFDPEKFSLPYLHRDHQGSGRLVLRHWRTLGQGRPTLYLFQTRRPDVAVDIGAEIERKLQALAAHRTQNLGMASRAGGFNRRAGQLFGLGYAETFRKLQ